MKGGGGDVSGRAEHRNKARGNTDSFPIQGRQHFYSHGGSHLYAKNKDEQQDWSLKGHDLGCPKKSMAETRRGSSAQLSNRFKAEIKRNVCTQHITAKGCVDGH